VVSDGGASRRRPWRCGTGRRRCPALLRSDPVRRARGKPGARGARTTKETTRPALTPRPAYRSRVRAKAARRCRRHGQASGLHMQLTARLRAVYGRKRGGGPTVEARVHSDVFRAVVHRNRACTARGRRSSETSSAL
jgi:hypothetical protein